MNVLKGGISLILFLILLNFAFAVATYESAENQCVCRGYVELLNGTREITNLASGPSENCKISESMCGSGPTYQCLYEGDYYMNYTCADLDNTMSSNNVPPTQISKVVKICNDFASCTGNLLTLISPTIFDIRYDVDKYACLYAPNVVGDFFDSTLHGSLETPRDSNMCCGDDGRNDSFSVTTTGYKFLCTNRSIDKLNDWNWTTSVSNDKFQIINDRQNKDSVVSGGSDGWFLCDATGNSPNSADYAPDHILGNHQTLSSSDTVSEYLYDPPCVADGKILVNGVQENGNCCYYIPTTTILDTNMNPPCYNSGGSTGYYPSSETITSGAVVAESGYIGAAALIGSATTTSTGVNTAPVSDCANTVDLNGNLLTSTPCNSVSSCNGVIVELNPNPDDKFCCVAENPECVSAPTCESQGLFDCGAGPDIFSCESGGGSLVNISGVETVCCLNNGDCAVSRSAFQRFATSSSSKIMCSQFNDASYMMECCNDFSRCNNLDLNSIENSVLENRNIVSMGGASNQIKSYDYESDPFYLVNAKSYNLGVHLSSVGLTDQISEFINGSLYDTLEFYLRINEVANSQGYYNVNNIDISLKADNNQIMMKYPLASISNRLLVKGNWIKVVFNITGFEFVLSSIIVDFKDGPARMNWYIDQLSLNSYTNPDLKNWYCSPLNSWIGTIGFNQSTIDNIGIDYDASNLDSELENWNDWKKDSGVDGEFSNLKNYITQKWTCDNNFAYGWTGTNCCGQDQTAQDNKYYKDTEAGCWAGYSISSEPVATTIFHDRGDRYMFDTLEFHECGYRSDNNIVISESDIFAEDPDDFCQVNGNYFCDYERTFYNDARLGTKLRNDSSMMIVVNQIFNGGFDEN